MKFIPSGKSSKVCDNCKSIHWSKRIKKNENLKK